MSSCSASLSGRTATARWTWRGLLLGLREAHCGIGAEDRERERETEREEEEVSCKVSSRRFPHPLPLVIPKTHRLRNAGVVAPTPARAATPLICKASSVGRLAFLFAIFVFECRGTGLGLPLLRFLELGGLGLPLSGAPAFRMWSPLLAFCFAFVRTPTLIFFLLVVVVVVVVVVFFFFCCSSSFFFFTPSFVPEVVVVVVAVVVVVVVVVLAGAATTALPDSTAAFIWLILASTSWW